MPEIIGLIVRLLRLFGMCAGYIDKALSRTGRYADAARGTFVIVDNSVVIRNDDRTVRTFFLAYLTAIQPFVHTVLVTLPLSFDEQRRATVLVSFRRNIR